MAKQSLARYTVAPSRPLPDIALPGLVLSGRVGVRTKLTHEQFDFLKRQVEQNLVHTGGLGMRAFEVIKPRTSRNAEQKAQDARRFSQLFATDPNTAFAASKAEQIRREKGKAKLEAQNRKRAELLAGLGEDVVLSLGGGGGGYYTILAGSDVIDSVRGKKKAEAALAAYQSSLDEIRAAAGKRTPAGGDDLPQDDDPSQGDDPDGDSVTPQTEE